MHHHHYILPSHHDIRMHCGSPSIHPNPQSPDHPGKHQLTLRWQKTLKKKLTSVQCHSEWFTLWLSYFLVGMGRSLDGGTPSILLPEIITAIFCGSNNLNNWWDIPNSGIFQSQIPTEGRLRETLFFAIFSLHMCNFVLPCHQPALEHLDQTSFCGSCSSSQTPWLSSFLNKFNKFPDW